MSEGPSLRPDRAANWNLGTIGILALILALAAGGIASCGKDDNPAGPVPETVVGAPPALPVPPPWSAPAFSFNAVAREAQVRVGAALNAAMMISRADESAVSALNRTWPKPSGSCWTRTENIATYLVCRTGAGFNWQTVWNGTGGLESPTYDHWVRLAGTSTLDGASGTLHTNVTNTQQVDRSWSWILGPDKKSGLWNFYAGDASPANLHASLERTLRTDGFEECAWTETGQVRWLFRRSAPGDSGSMRFLTWSPGGGWVPEVEISWGSGHGRWLDLDSGGGVVRTRTW